MMKEPVLLLVSVFSALELVLSETDVVGDEVVRRQPVTGVDSAIHQLRHLTVIFNSREGIVGHQILLGDHRAESQMHVALEGRDAGKDAGEILALFFDVFFRP